MANEAINLNRTEVKQALHRTERVLDDHEARLLAEKALISQLARNVHIQLCSIFSRLVEWAAYTNSSRSFGFVGLIAAADDSKIRQPYKGVQEYN